MTSRYLTRTRVIASLGEARREWRGASKHVYLTGIFEIVMFWRFWSSPEAEFNDYTSNIFQIVIVFCEKHDFWENLFEIVIVTPAPARRLIAPANMSYKSFHFDKIFDILYLRKIAMQMIGIGFIISVIQDSMETALNSSGDAIFTATAEFRSWLKDGRKLPLWKK